MLVPDFSFVAWWISLSVSSFVFPVWLQPCSGAEDDSSTLTLPLCDLPTAVGSPPSMSARFVWGAGTPFLAGRDGTECLFRCMMQTQSSRSSHTLRDEACGGSGRPAQTSLLPRPMCRTADCAGGMISPSPATVWAAGQQGMRRGTATPKKGMRL